MLETYLHRLSRPYRAAAATGAGAFALDPEPAATSERDVAGEQDVTGERSGSNERRLAAERGGEVRRVVAEPEPGDFAGPSVPPTGYRRPNSATARRRRAADACEVCGRTLLAGERAREIIVGERPVQACALCVIGAQRAARVRAA
jgi:hypothetical protein